MVDGTPVKVQRHPTLERPPVLPNGLRHRPVPPDPKSASSDARNAYCGKRRAALSTNWHECCATLQDNPSQLGLSVFSRANAGHYEADGYRGTRLAGWTPWRVGHNGTILTVLLTTETAYQNPQSGNTTFQWNSRWVEPVRAKYPLLTRVR
jgi:hypothetical protein